MTEDQLLQLVRQACKALGVTCYHTHRSDRSEPGFPDLTLVGEHLAFRELKSAKGKTTRMQDYWLAILGEAGVDAAVWRPADWPDRILAELRALGRCSPAPGPTPAELRKTLHRRRQKVVPPSYQGR
jgi:hypothetical protein